MKTYFIKLLFNFTSFLCDLTKGNTLFVKYRLLLGSILIGMSLPACNTGNTSKVSGKITPMMKPLNSMHHINHPSPYESLHSVCYFVVNVDVEPDTVVADPNEIYSYVDEMPEFLACKGDVLRWISANLKYPPTDDCVQGRVTVKIVIDEEGVVSDVKIVRSLSPLYDKEAMRVIRAMPRWKPGKMDGKVVKVYYTIPVTFVLK